MSISPQFKNPPNRNKTHLSNQEIAWFCFFSTWSGVSSRLTRGTRTSTGSWCSWTQPRPKTRPSWLSGGEKVFKATATSPKSRKLNNLSNLCGISGKLMRPQQPHHPRHTQNDSFSKIYIPLDFPFFKEMEARTRKDFYILKNNLHLSLQGKLLYSRNTIIAYFFKNTTKNEYLI